MVLQEKVAIITGAANGIGQTGARLFSKEGAKIVIADINDNEGEETAKGIREQGNDAIFVHTDVCSVRDLENMVKKAVEIYGRLDIFWHNAGTFLEGHIDLVEEEKFDKELQINLKGAVFGTKFVIREMRKVGGGCILYTSSMVGLRPTPYTARYSLTHILGKAGLVMLARCLVEPLAKDNIRVNCVCPGPVRTALWNSGLIKEAEKEGVSTEEVLRNRLKRIPLGRCFAPEEIAKVALFLVSDMSSPITGVSLAADGGFAAV
jgi:3-oxoacyl-[acyl-carrier protein] reductase